MAVRKEAKVVDLTQLDELLQCPVCYEVPHAHIYQCNQGHHVCGPCKARISVCPVCRCLFFGTRNYAMEELIANIRKMRLTTPPASDASPVIETNENLSADSTNTSTQNTPSTSASEGRPPAPVSSRGLFRCLCCKNGETQRLPMARLLNHLRYFHRGDLVEGRMENDKYEQSWQVSTETKHREVIALRIAEMGIFFLVVEVAEEQLSAWLSMAASNEEANKFCFQLTITCTDREACFTDNVKSTRACEGQIKKRLRCLAVTGENLRSFYQGSAVVSRVCISRISQGVDDVEPRTAMRIANLPSSRTITDLMNQLVTSPQAATPAQRSIQRPAAPRAPLQQAPSQHHQIPSIESLLRHTEHALQALQSNITSNVAPHSTQHSNVPWRESNTSVNHGQPLSRNARRRLRQLVRQSVEASVHSNGDNVQHTSARAATPSHNQARAPASLTSRASAPTANSNRAQASIGGAESAPVSANMRQVANRATGNNRPQAPVQVIAPASDRRTNSAGLTASSLNINQAQPQGNFNRPASAPTVNRNRRTVAANQLDFDAVTRPETVNRGRGRRSRR